MKAGDQIVQSKARRKRKRSWRKESEAARAPVSLSAFLFPIGKVVGILVLILVILIVVYKPIASSSIFDLEEVVTEGNIHVPTRQVESLVREAIGESLLAGDLTRVRESLKQQPLIKDAIVTRILPHTLRAKVFEREPVAVVEVSGKLVTIDHDGVVLGGFQLMGDQPPLLGWGEEGQADRARSTNQERLRLYLELKTILSEPEFYYWDRIDQVDIRDPNDVVISFKRSPAIEIHLGHREFRERFTLLLHIVEAIRDRDRAQLERLEILVDDEILEGKLKITYIDVSKAPPRVWAQRRLDEVQPTTNR